MSQEEIYEIPQAFAERMKEMLGDEWDAFLEGYAGRRYRALRFNTRKADYSPETECRILQEAVPGEPDPVPWAEHAYYYGEEAAPGKSVYHDLGAYYIQEPSAMSAAVLLNPQSGDLVLDLCAAPGGKTTQLASLLGPEGLLVANEIHPQRSRILSQNVERMGINNAIVTNEDPRDLSARFPSFFHRILVDAPCSGEGMFRKNEEALEEWTPENVIMCAERQSYILDCAADMLMPGGTMVYSTCTFSPEENERSIAEFLRRHPEFSLLSPEMDFFTPGRPEWADGNPEIAKTCRLWPHKLRGEGHFLAKLKKDGEYLPAAGTKSLAGGKKKRREKPVLDKEQTALLQEFSQSNLTAEYSDWLMSGKLQLFGDNLYRLPQDAPELSCLRIQRAGLHVGSFQKKRFEPAHALALSLGRGDVLRKLDLAADSPEAAAFLRGETLMGGEGKGWILIAIGGLSAGWGKTAGGQIKNHYPRGLRRMK